jgi:KaiC/GvpD/RAD55 family RecA-like ATPase
MSKSQPDDNDLLRQGTLGTDPFKDLVPAAAEPDAFRRERNSESADDFRTLAVSMILAHEEGRLELEPKRLATGWDRLDAALGGGLVVPSLNLLGAAPKSGKSTFAQMVAERVVEQGGVVYYLDLENGRRRFLRRQLCRRAGLGAKQVASALAEHRRGSAAPAEMVARWAAAKAWVRETLGKGLFVEFTRPSDLRARVAAARGVAGDRPVLVVIDSLQKLLQNLEDRRAEVDKLTRLFEQLRYEYEVTFLVVSEIKRDKDGTYRPHEAAFKESGGLEYSADLALTLTRPAADELEGEKDAPSTLRVELARESDEDPRGDIAAYMPARPHFGLSEGDPPRRFRTVSPDRRSRAARGAAAPCEASVGGGYGDND